MFTGTNSSVAGHVLDVGVVQGNLDADFSEWAGPTPYSPIFRHTGSDPDNTSQHILDISRG